MMYVIAQLSGWLLLTAFFAALGGWAFAAKRAAPAEAAARKERNKLMRDLINISAEDHAPANGVSEQLEREMDMLRRRAELDASRVAELEAAMESARARADEAQGHAAELQRALERSDSDAEELRRLRGLVAEAAERDANVVDAEVQPVAALVEDDDSVLQMWRLRYFEQRVEYLEQKNAAAPAAAAAPAPAAPTTGAEAKEMEWRARTAEARVAHLEQELRARDTPHPVASEPPPVTEDAAISPFAADADVDILLRWRLLYLERRVAYLQEAQQAGHEAPATTSPPIVEDVSEAAPDPDRWKWRARYLEARVRHLEARLEETPPPPLAPQALVVMEQDIQESAALAAPPPQAQPLQAEPATALPTARDDDDEDGPPPPPLVPRGQEKRPTTLPAARGGAPDDLTLIDGISLLQQTTFYSLGVYHFEQIAAWTPANIAWVDNYLRLRGRIVEEEWVEQAHALAREGPSAARRLSEEEPA